MNPTVVGLIFRKELIDFLRDRRTLIGLIVFPVFVMPTLMFGMGYFINKSQREAREKQLTVAIAERASIDGLTAALQSAGFVLKPVNDPKEAVTKKQADAGLEVLATEKGVTARVFTDNTQPQGNVMASRIRDQLNALRQQRVSSDLKKYNVPESVLQPFLTEAVNTAPPQRMGGMAVGMLIGFVLVIFMITAGMYPAMDMTAGEKERRTIEMLLVSPVTRAEIVGGKLLATFAATVATSLLSVTSFGASYYYARQPGGMLSRLQAPQIDGSTMALLCIAALVEAAFCASIVLAISAAAKSVREATSYVTPVIFVAMLSGYAVITPGVKLPVAEWMLPFANFVKLTKDLLMGDWSPSIFALTITANLLYVAVAYYATIRCFTSERLVLKT